MGFSSSQPERRGTESFAGGRRSRTEMTTSKRRKEESASPGSPGAIGRASQDQAWTIWKRGLLALFVAIAACLPAYGQARLSPSLQVETATARDDLPASEEVRPAPEDGVAAMRFQTPIERRPSRHHRQRTPSDPAASPKYSFLAGGGFTLPTASTADSFATGYRFQGGAGRNFNRKAALFLQFDWDGLSIKNTVLGELLPVYQRACGDSCTGTPIAELFAANHTWSFTLDPVVTVAGNKQRNAYVVGGVGFYHKVTSFSAPAASSSCDGCAQYPTYGTFDRYISNAPGFNAGVGVTRAVGHTDAHFYADVRFVYVHNVARPYSVTKLGPGFNAFPANSQPTSLVPVTFGFRW